MTTLITSPIFYIFLLLLASYIFRHKRRTRIAFLTTAVIFILFFTSRPIYDYVFNKWTEDYATEIKDGKVYHYGIVLGGFGSWDEERNRPEFDQRADRLLEGIQLYRKGKIKKLVIASDGSNRIPEDLDETSGNPAGMRAYIERFGVAPSDLILENKATTTRENAQTLSRLLGNSLKKERPLIITSAEHMRRALITFEQVGIPADGFATDCVVKEKGKSLFSLTVMNDWKSLLHEFIGYLYYQSS